MRVKNETPKTKQRVVNREVSEVKRIVTRTRYRGRKRERERESGIKIEEEDPVPGVCPYSTACGLHSKV